jgi:antitoxin component of MazEF toxin-antitoxin module
MNKIGRNASPPVPAPSGHETNSSIPAGLVLQNARVFKAGNSLAIRIPSAIAKHCELEDGSAVEMAADHGTLYVRKYPSLDLAGLIDRITADNIHAPEFDEPTGAERW